ncbi:transcriptional regulator [Achromobacter seleniivolatilans]|uniref:Transcriptional regulator n=1 Tax=Achromobacter seleniivolatilans TaxID=3047478 RepID=A0ABY9LXC1_9BURK|nr:PhaM family polyhydroxyalkanoate granule multifunctional regulatory protein [Achromobacter sp. R39]WMD19008.1 transcriptional regulator [Achromobacter sp. R39]
MSDQFTNPFVLPGMGQQSDLSGNPLLASMEMMRQAWAGLTGPGGLASSLPMAPPMNLEDLDRRIAELRSVESWLRMNLSMLSSTIQGMEVQRSTISTLRAFVDSAASMDLGAVRDSGAASPLEVVLGLKPAPKTSAPAASAQENKSQDASANKDAGQEANPNAAPDSGAAAMSEQMGAAAQSASKAWWDLLQQQFTQIATATAASMPASPAAPGADAASASKAKPGESKAAAKTSAKASKPAAKSAAKTAVKRGTAAAKKTGPADGKP